MASGLRGSAGLTGQGQQVFKRGSTSLEQFGARDSVGTSHVGCCHPGPSRWIYSDLLESGPSADGHTQNFTAEDSLARRGCVVASPLVTVATHPRERGGCFELYCPAFSTQCCLSCPRLRNESPAQEPPDTRLMGGVCPTSSPEVLVRGATPVGGVVRRVPGSTYTDPRGGVSATGVHTIESPLGLGASRLRQRSG